MGVGILIKIIKDISLSKNKIEFITKYIDKDILIFTITNLFIVSVFCFINMTSIFLLTNLGRQNLYTLKQMEKENNEISQIKEELLKLNNVSVFKEHIKSNNYIDKIEIKK